MDEQDNHIIPSKQLQYAGSMQELTDNLLKREIGFCTENGCCFIKDARGELVPVGRDPEKDYLLKVAHDKSLAGDGTETSPLKVDLSSEGLNIHATENSVTVGEATFERTPEMTAEEVVELLTELT